MSRLLEKYLIYTLHPHFFLPVVHNMSSVKVFRMGTSHCRFTMTTTLMIKSQE